MKIKLRALTYTKKGKLLSLANEVADEFATSHRADVIPPAYPCETERLVVIFLSSASNYSRSFEIFCKNMNKSVAHNVAVVLDGSKEKAEPVFEWLRSAGCHFCEDIFEINGGLPFKFMKKFSPEEKEQLFAWVEKTISEMA